MSPPLPLWLNLARSGGTLLARCLGCMRGILLLSEVHPLGVRIIDPAEQAAGWHGLLRASELAGARAGRMRYDDLMALLAERASQRGQTLLLRDWSHLDFLGAPFGEPSFTSRSSLLLGARFDLRRFATTRHPADQWASQQRLDLLRGKVDPAVYLRGSRAFAALAVETGFVRYEDFTADPDGQLARLCGSLALPFDAEWRAKYRAYTKVTGDVEAPTARVGEIHAATRREPDRATRALFEASDDYREACRLLGYEP